MKKNTCLLSAIITSLIFCLSSFAKESDGSIDDLGEVSVSDKVVRDDFKQADDTSGLSVIGRIDPFKDVVVLQKRFLPKQYRYEASASLGMISDNPFFITSVLHARLAYYFSDIYGLELSYFKASTSSSKISDNLLEKASVSSSTLSVPESFIGGALKLTPIYGKISFWNNTIIPFDNYYLLGLGQTSIKGESSAMTFHGGVGFVFALKKWLGAKIELDFYSYENAVKSSFLDTHINVGISMYFPKAKYR